MTRLDGSGDETFPLSFAQEQRLWLVLERGLDTPAYNLAYGFRIHGGLNYDALQAAVDEIVNRHESLRASILLPRNGTPRQRILWRVQTPVTLVEVEGARGAARDSALDSRLAASLAEPFDVLNGPLIRARLFRLGPDHHAFALVVHSIIADGWSLGLLGGELGSVYTSFAQGRPYSLPRVTHRYSDFCVRERQSVSSAQLTRNGAYWRTQLTGVKPVALPTDHSRPSHEAFAGSTLDVSIPPRLSGTIIDFSTQHRVTPFVTLLAAFQILLARHADTDDVTIGSPFAGRSRTEVASTVGFFVNTLMLRSRVAVDLTFETFLLNVRSRVIAAMVHQPVLFRGLFDTEQASALAHYQSLAYQNFPWLDFRPQGLDVQPLNVRRPIARRDLDIELWLEAGQFCGEFIYRRDLFAQSTIEDLAKEFEELLETVVTDTRIRLGALRHV